VTIFGSHGEATPTSAQTDAYGQAQVILVAEYMPEQATITTMAEYTAKSTKLVVMSTIANPALTPSAFLPIIKK
jgi:hypothetical protein